VVGALIAFGAVTGVAGGLTMIGQEKGGPIDVSAQSPRIRSATATAAAAATAGAPAGAATPASAAAARTTRQLGTPPTSTAGNRRPAATAATAATATTRASTTAPNAPQALVASPAAPGTYRYRQSGSLAGTPAEGTLVVAPASTSGTQTWARVVGGTVAPSSTVMLFNASGAFMVAPGAAAAGGPQTCSFATPVPWPPWPTTIGRRASAHATCTGTISSYDVTTEVQGSAAMTLDGKTVNIMAVVNMIVISGTANGSPLHATLTETDYYAATLRVPVQVKTHLAGTVLGLSVTTDRTDTLESATPS